MNPNLWLHSISEYVIHLPCPKHVNIKLQVKFSSLQLRVRSLSWWARASILFTVSTLFISIALHLLCARWYFSHSQTSECYARWFFFIVIVTLMRFPFILVRFNSFWRCCFTDELYWGPVLGREVFERMMMWGYRVWWVLIVSFAMFNTIPSLKWWVKTIQTRVSEPMATILIFICQSTDLKHDFDFCTWCHCHLTYAV